MLNAQSVEDVLAKYEVAAGGKEKLLGVKQLEVMGTVKMGVMGQVIELPITVLREQGKLFRRQLGGIMGMGDTYNCNRYRWICFYSFNQRVWRYARY